MERITAGSDREIPMRPSSAQEAHATDGARSALHRGALSTPLPSASCSLILLNLRKGPSPVHPVCKCDPLLFIRLVSLPLVCFPSRARSVGRLVRLDGVGAHACGCGLRRREEHSRHSKDAGSFGEPLSVHLPVAVSSPSACGEALCASQPSQCFHPTFLISPATDFQRMEASTPIGGQSAFYFFSAYCVRSLPCLPRDASPFPVQETQGVAVVAFGSDEFPAFFTPHSGCKVTLSSSSCPCSALPALMGRQSSSSSLVQIFFASFHRHPSA